MTRYTLREDAWEAAVVKVPQQKVFAANLSVQMILKLEAMANIVSNAEFAKMTEHERRLPFELLRMTYNNTYRDSANIDKSDVLALLLSAPCYGAGKTSLNKDSVPVSWLNGDVFSLAGMSVARDSIRPSERTGLGYMICYNLYRMVYNDSTNMVYRDRTCPCVSSALVNEISNYTTLEMDNLEKITAISGTYMTPADYPIIKT